MQGRLSGIRGLQALESTAERALAGRIAAALYLTASASVVLMLAVDNGDFVHPWLALACAGIGTAWGVLAATVVPWERGPPALTHGSTSLGLVLVALVGISLDAAHSPVQHFLIFVVVYAAYFYPAREAIPYVAASVAVHALPFLYRGEVGSDLLLDLVVAVPSYAVVATAIIMGRGMLRRMAEEQRRLTQEQASLRKVATMVAAGSPQHAIFALVASEMRHLLASDAAGVVKLEPSGEATVLASSGVGGAPYQTGTRIDLDETPELAHVRDTGTPCRLDSERPDSPRAYRSRLCVPFFVEGRLWGGLCLGARDPFGLAPDAEERLAAFAELLAVAIASTEDRERLVFEAGRDLLTGVGNHRSFYARLEEEEGRARRYSAPLSLALVDVDHFRRLNERVGTEVADMALVEIARLLGEVTRAEDTVARVHGDQFALIMPGVDKRGALVVTERLRQLVAATMFPRAVRLRVSAGICDIETAGDATGLVRLANGALYWAKSNGRDSSWIYDPSVVRSLSAQERAEYLERSQGLVGLRALARAIDAKDGTTRQHSERVAELAEQLAVALGWTAHRTERLREAALVHDVGKIGVPDAILLKPGRLSEEEYAIVKEHAALSAQIVEGVLSDEQVGWVRAHHERPDGRGYPAGLYGTDTIPEGAGIIALADAWDAMTAPRLYSVAKDPADAIVECRELAGRQFLPACVGALEHLYEQGRLGPARTGALTAAGA